MSVVARFTIPATQFVLGELLEAREGITVRLESMIPTGDAVVPYLWVPRDDADAVHAALQQAKAVDEVTIVDETETETLFRVTWSSDVNGLLDVIQDSKAVLLQAEGLSDNWSFRMRFSEREELSEFYQVCLDRGLTPDLEEVNNPFQSGQRSEFGVSDAQRDALLTALEDGYFDVPRRINLMGLADELEISDTAVSQRIRRGMTALLTSTLARRSVRGRTDDDMHE